MPIERQVLSDGGFQYEVVENWAKLPPELTLGEVAAVAVDAVTPSSCSPAANIPW
jgi:hypothetical protein